MKRGKTIQEIEIAEKSTFTKTINGAGIVNYAGITGDFNPVHINSEYAQKTKFKGRIVHGMLSVGLISTILGNDLPGPGSIFVSQNINFIAPVRIGDTVTASVKVIDKDEEKNKLYLETICKNEKDNLIIDGEAVIMPPKKNLFLKFQKEGNDGN